MLRGCITAIITPFRNGRVDLPAFRSLVLRQKNAGVSGILAGGTTGESPNLGLEELLELIRCVKELSQEADFVIMAGCGTYSTRASCEKAARLAESGATHLLVVSPYYNRPTQQGLVEHFREVARASAQPIVVYNIPGRCGVNIEPKTLRTISDIPGVIGVKEASGNMGQIAVLRGMIPRPDFAILSGDDLLTLPVLSVGGSGVISVTGNLVPGRVQELVDAFLGGDHGRALELHNRLFELTAALFIESNPIMVKSALSLMGLAGSELRLPLTAPLGENLARLSEVLKKYELLN